MSGNASVAPKRARLLIVEDDAVLAGAMGDLLVAQGYRCDVAGGGAEALAALAESPFDLVISDLAMDGMSGIELLDRTNQSARPLPFIFVSAVVDASVLADALHHGAYRCLRKPYDARDLHMLVERALFERDRTRLLDRGGTAELPLPGTMAELEAGIERMAKSTAPAIILGETGTGKELVARAIHARSDRRERPFVAVNASAIPDQLLESELFGHVRGAFTGAALARHGLLVEADGGTLLLDEIGDMPLALQAKLLRVVQFGEIRPVGGDRTRHVDVRVIAATHRDLAAMVQAGRFRADLYFRLNVLPLVIKPLRERRGDIAPLAAAFLERARARTPSSPLRGLCPDALALLESAPWPGNVRELESVFERLVVLAKGELATAADLAFVVDAAPAPFERDAASFVPLRRWVGDYVARVLAHTGGNKARAAEILGVDLSTVYRWQRRLPVVSIEGSSLVTARAAASTARRFNPIETSASKMRASPARLTSRVRPRVARFATSRPIVSMSETTRPSSRCSAESSSSAGPPTISRRRTPPSRSRSPKRAISFIAASEVASARRTA